MAGETNICLVGNATADPDLRFTPNGAAVANFTVASTPRSFDKRSGEYRDGETLFLRCTAWRDMAENVATTVRRGTRLIVSGRLRARSFETKDGESRTVFEVDVDDVGPSLRYATADVHKNARPDQRDQADQRAGSWGREQTVHGAGNGSGTSTDDPWAASNPNQDQGHRIDEQFSGPGVQFGAGQTSEEPPF